MQESNEVTCWVSPSTSIIIINNFFYVLHGCQIFLYACFVCVVLRVSSIQQPSPKCKLIALISSRE